MEKLLFHKIPFLSWNLLRSACLETDINRECVRYEDSTAFTHCFAYFRSKRTAYFPRHD